MATPEFTSAALYQSAQAWVGAIHEVNGMVAKREPTTFEEMRDFLFAYDLPLLPATLTTPVLAKRLGIKG